MSSFVQMMPKLLFKVHHPINSPQSILTIILFLIFTDGYQLTDSA